LIAEANARAEEAEERVAQALARAEKLRHDADQQASDLLANARRNADRVLQDARSFAERTLSEAVEEAERERISVQRQVDDLNRQRESITGYLEELRGLLGATPMPIIDGVLDSAPAPAALPAGAQEAAGYGYEGQPYEAGADDLADDAVLVVESTQAELFTEAEFVGADGAEPDQTA
jgi:hypothetical protein